MTRKEVLAKLHTRILACRKCLEAGYRIAPGPVVHGVHTAKVMTIGQAPGPTEAVVKRPFNAGSGKRLFQWLGEAGFDETEFRAKMYMTAITKCYPGRSNGGHGDRSTRIAGVVPPVAGSRDRNRQSQTDHSNRPPGHRPVFRHPPSAGRHYRHTDRARGPDDHSPASSLGSEYVVSEAGEPGAGEEGHSIDPQTARGVGLVNRHAVFASRKHCVSAADYFSIGAPTRLPHSVHEPS